MLDTAILLTKPSKQALVEIINYHNETLLEENKVTFDEITPVSGRNTRVKVVSTAAPNALYSGFTHFTFNRLNLTEFFQPVTMNIQIGYPSTTYNILQKLSEMFGMVMDEADFEIHEFNSLGSYTYNLTAKADSLRWHGSVVINVEVTTALIDYLLVDILNGLNEFSIDTPLENLYQILVLNGLTYGDFGLNIQGLLTATKLNSLWVDEGLGPVITTDLSLTGQDMVKQAIQEVALAGVDPLFYGLGTPTPMLGDRNTAIEVVANGNSLLSGSATVYYNRINLTQVLTGYVPASVEVYPLPEEVLAIVNAETGLNLQFMDVAVTDLAGGEYGLTAKPGSFAYIGSINISFPPPENAIAGFDGDLLGGFDGDYIGDFA